MSDLLQYLARLTSAQSVEELWTRHCVRMAGFGIDRLIYGFTRYRTESGLGDPQDMVLLSNLPRTYMDGFIDDGLFLEAPMVRWALEHEGSCSWRQIGDMLTAQPSARMERVIEFNRAHGVNVGYSISFHSVSRRAKGAVGLIAREGLSQDDMDAIWARHGVEIELLNTVAHLKLLTLPYSAGRQLTSRQREVLEWVGDGKTTADIAQIMGLTAATIEKHMRLAREAMDVDTTAQAVLKASFQNQMFVLGQ
ncbi:MAG: LuxR family transcriptional regulator [Rhodobacterales bacterium]|nr:MAG: LuxR family transcriptional regulator [Rhodobacterales bacterium]